MLDGFAFLPVDKVEAAFQFPLQIAPPGTKELTTYFGATYVNGTYKRVQSTSNPLQVRFVHVPPIVPPKMWHVNQITLNGEQRTNNQIEGWNHRFSNIVKINHPGPHKLFKKCYLNLPVIAQNWHKEV
jgi:hypothetical protein